MKLFCGPGLDILFAGRGLIIQCAGRARAGLQNCCGPGPGPGIKMNHICGLGLGLDFRPVQGPAAQDHFIFSHSADYMINPIEFKQPHVQLSRTLFLRKWLQSPHHLLINLSEPFFRHDRRTAPKFGTHVRIETRLALTKTIDKPHPRGV